MASVGDEVMQQRLFVFFSLFLSILYMVGKGKLATFAVTI